jgi:cleavage and polyadenylation specificity factor subunit 3
MALAGAGVKRPAADDAQVEVNTLKLCPLGAGAEVGRSCLILRFKGKVIMLDAGILPSFKGEEALPLLREIDPAEVDIVIITHFHIDHCAALPHFTERMTGFRGRIFATHPTIAVMRMVLQDFVRVSKIGSDDAGFLYSQADVDRCMARMEALDLRQRATVGGVQLTFYNAGHVLGACMVNVEVAGVSVLYTGDYSCEEDRHLMAAEAPPGLRPDLLVVEATYGLQVHEGREAREKRFLDAVEKVVKRGGRCLIPVFALGRAQELLLILEEHWAAHPELRGVPIWHASRMGDRSLDVYRTFTSHMNAKVQAAVGERNPWTFQYVKPCSPSEFRDVGPCVMLAAPGMLQPGFSRDLFDRWCEDAKNGVVLAGYSVEGTLARTLESNPVEVESSARRRLIRRCLIERVSFSAHADSVQTAKFIEAVRPCAIVLVHGERNEMSRLHSALARKYDGTPGFRGVRMPGNNVTFTMEFKEQKLARVVGRLAERALARTLGLGGGGTGNVLSGLLVTRNFEHLLLAPGELPAFTQLATHSVAQTLHVPYRSSLGMLRAFVRSMYSEVEEGVEREAARPTLLVAGLVTLTYAPPDRMLMAWRASPQADIIADSLVAVVNAAEVSQASIRATSRPCNHAHGAAGTTTLPILPSLGAPPAMEEAAAPAPPDDDAREVACLLDVPWAAAILASDAGPFTAAGEGEMAATGAGPVPESYVAAEHLEAAARGEAALPAPLRRRRNYVLSVLTTQYGERALQYVPGGGEGVPSFAIRLRLDAREARVLGGGDAGGLSVMSEDDDLRAATTRAVEITDALLRPLSFSSLGAE